MKKVVFCTPGASFSDTWVACWTDLAFYCAQNRIAFIHQPGKFHNIHGVRDLCLGINIGRVGQQPFGGTLDYDYIMWLDSDQTWTNDDFQKLLDADEDIVSGWYALNDSTNSGRGICAGWYDEKVLLERDGMPCVTLRALTTAERTDKGLVDLGGMHPEYDYPWVGLGFCLVKKGVFENIPYPWFYDDNIRVGDIISNRGDDISFCKKAHEAGYKIHIHPEVRVGHEKMVVL